MRKREKTVPGRREVKQYVTDEDGKSHYFMFSTKSVIKQIALHLWL